MTKYELTREAVTLYNYLRIQGLSHNLALRAVVEFVISRSGNVASDDASDDAKEGD